MDESVISTYTDVKFIEGLTKMTQRNWQAYFGTALKSGVYKGLNQRCFDDETFPRKLMDGVVYVNGIRAELSTEDGYTEIPSVASGVLDRLICVRVHFNAEVCELVEKDNLTTEGANVNQTNEKLMETYLKLCADESLYCERNAQYWDVPIFYQSALWDYWFGAGKDMRRVVSQEKKLDIVTSLDVTGMRQWYGNVLISGQYYYQNANRSSTVTYYMDTVNVADGAILSCPKYGSSSTIRLSKIPFTNNFCVGSSVSSAFPVPDSMVTNKQIQYIFSEKNWDERTNYCDLTIPAGKEKGFRFTFRGVNYVESQGVLNINFMYFVEEILSSATVQWGNIGGHITDQSDLQSSFAEVTSDFQEADAGLQTQINAKAPIASPAFTGTPTAPTPDVSDDSTAIATTAFVKAYTENDKHSETTLTVGDVLPEGSTDYSEYPNFSTIQVAINYARGDVPVQIVIAPGTYNELLSIGSKKITLRVNDVGTKTVRIANVDSASSPVISVTCGQLLLSGYFDLWSRGGHISVKRGATVIVNENWNSKIYLTQANANNTTQHCIYIDDNSSFICDTLIDYRLASDKSDFVTCIYATDASYASVKNFQTNRDTYTQSGTYDIVSDKSIVWVTNCLNENTPRYKCISGGVISTSTDAIVNQESAPISGFAQIMSPTFRGVPNAPTAESGTRTSQIATTAFVTDAVSEKADIDSPTFIGKPLAPTAESGTSSRQIATTAFVANAVSGKANIDSPEFTGMPTAPTATKGTNTTQIATTAFVKTAVDGNLETDLYVGYSNSAPNFSKIQDAIDYARSDKEVTIHIYPGSYNENIIVGNKNIKFTVDTNGKLTISEGNDGLYTILVDRGHLTISAFAEIISTNSCLGVVNGGSVSIPKNWNNSVILSQYNESAAYANYCISLYDGSRFSCDSAIRFDLRSGYYDNVKSLYSGGASVAYLESYSSNRVGTGVDLHADGGIIMYHSYTGSYSELTSKVNGGQIFKS